MQRELTYLLGAITCCVCIMAMLVTIGVPNLAHKVYPDSEPNPYIVHTFDELKGRLQESLSQVELLYYLLHQNSYESAVESTLENGDSVHLFPTLGWKVTKFADKKILPRAERIS